jgi:hypothetical protein
MSKLVSIKQAEILKELGFTEITQRYAYKSINGNKFKLAENIGKNYRYA